MRKLLKISAAILILNFQFSIFNSVKAQCAMCRRVAETNYEQKAEANVAIKRGKSLNNGILYLLSVPYILGAAGAFAWYKNRKKI